MAKGKKKIRPIDTAPLGSTPIDIETFIDGIDANYKAGEYDEELEQELAPTEVNNIRKVDTIYDVLIDVFHQAADEFAVRNGGIGRFYLTIKPQAFQEGDYVAIITMSLNYQSVVSGGQLVCEKKFGLVTLEQLSEDNWKASLVKEMITELFSITSLFIEAKKDVKHSDVIKMKVREGDKRRKEESKKKE
jgi:hypothetical protein